MLRRDLEVVERLVGDVRNGRPADEVRSEVAELEANGPLFRLKTSCLAYCRFVHSHHRLEDAVLFATLRRAEPEVGPVVDRLEREHVEVAALIAAVESAVEKLTADEARRAELAEALEALGRRLLAHLDFEEERIGPAIRRLERL